MSDSFETTAHPSLQKTLTSNWEPIYDVPAQIKWRSFKNVAEDFAKFYNKCSFADNGESWHLFLKALKFHAEMFLPKVPSVHGYWVYRRYNAVPANTIDKIGNKLLNDYPDLALFYGQWPLKPLLTNVIQTFNNNLKKTECVNMRKKVPIEKMRLAFPHLEFEGGKTLYSNSFDYVLIYR